MRVFLFAQNRIKDSTSFEKEIMDSNLFNLYLIIRG